MVYFYTSGNVKVVINILQNYEQVEELSPFEYIKNYIERCPEDSKDSKIAWTVETFLGVQKHYQFLNELGSHIAPGSSDEEHASLIVLMYGIIFDVEPKDMQQVYKSLFNLSKNLLDFFTSFFVKKEALPFISQLAQTTYDTTFISEKVLSPLFTWLPYIKEMAQNYSEYVKKRGRQKIKLPTVPIQPNFLSHKNKKAVLPLPTISSTLIQQKSQNKKMLSKSVIDQKIDEEHEKNKKKAASLLNVVRSSSQHYAQGKSEKYKNKLDRIVTENENEFRSQQKQRPKIVNRSTVVKVKETAASLKRVNKRIQQEEHQEIHWLENIIVNCTNSTNYELLEEQDRRVRERERLVDIEKKHLLGQITHEEAIISKKKLQEENKRKYEDFLKEKESWYDEIEQWKVAELEKNQKQVEKLSLIELSLMEAKTIAALKKKETADKVKSELEQLQSEALKAKNEELERRIRVIKEIKIISSIAKKAKVPKIIDLTETSGIGLLCEMSFAELQERLNAFKMTLKEELEIKKKTIQEENNSAKQELEKTKASIQKYISERAKLKAQNKKHDVAPSSNLSIQSSQEIKGLKKMLENKRKLRMKMTSEVMV